jgi:Zn-finger nucleic acid-binding protein
MTRVLEDDIKSAVCGNCFGTWIDEVALMRRTRMDAGRESQTGENAGAGVAAAASVPSLSELAEIVQTSNSREMLRCAVCEKPLLKERFHPMIPVEVDRCRECKCVFLDAGELALVRRLYVELMTTDDPEILRRRDKVAAVAAQWQARKDSVLEARDNLQDALTHRSRHATADAFDLLGYLLRSL